ncbi:MAG: tyrosine-type recombinase/integrase [Blastocatellia bacterium]
MSVCQSFGSLVKRAKLVDLRFHDLRHTFATRLAETGTDMPPLAALLGHRSFDMTKRYAHATDMNLRRAVSVLEGYAENHGQENHKINQMGEIARAG